MWSTYGKNPLLPEGALFTGPVHLHEIVRCEYDLYTQERILLREFMILGRVTHERAIHALWGYDKDGGPINLKGTLSVIMRGIRKKLKPEATIYNEFNAAYELVYEKNTKIDQRYAAE